jgi:hypothetical protein
MNLPTCQCGQTYALNPSTLMATPGYRTEPVDTLAPVVDVYGQTHGQAVTKTDRWVQEGPAVQARRDPETGNPTWPCVVCSLPVIHRTVAMVQVACTHNAPQGVPGGVCRVRENQVRPPSDLYVNVRHGAACPCCGHQGTHTIPLGAVGDALPACLRS